MSDKQTKQKKAPKNKALVTNRKNASQMFKSNVRALETGGMETHVQACPLCLSFRKDRRARQVMSINNRILALDFAALKTEYKGVTDTIIIDHIEAYDLWQYADRMRRALLLRNIIYATSAKKALSDGMRVSIGDQLNKITGAYQQQEKPRGSVQVFQQIINAMDVSSALAQARRFGGEVTEGRESVEEGQAKATG